MNYILHFTSIESIEEYIVITDEDNEEGSWDEYCMTGYELNNVYPIDDIGILPANRMLISK